ncbi:unnamed protein product, partial [Prorocentrum cordatum]
ERRAAIERQRLQWLVRDFSHEVVGPGLEVEARSQSLRDGAGGAEGCLEARLRMDRRLGQVELWPVGRHEGLRESRAALTIHLADIERLIKGGEQPGAELATAGRRHTRRQSAGATQATDRLLSRLEYNASLTFIGKSAELVRLIFDTPAARDRAYTCFRILQISAQAAEPFAAA